MRFILGEANQALLPPTSRKGKATDRRSQIRPITEAMVTSGGAQPSVNPGSLPQSQLA